MIQYGDHVDDHENIRVRVRGRGQNPWSTQQKQTDRTSLKNCNNFIKNLDRRLIFRVNCTESRDASF
jgi:hypothetical protein